tara:strand:- start:5663 stop:6541 length:879 start_codon:yes stop_codon:yes gene_type:complete
LRKIAIILIGITAVINCSAQSNLDFEKWNVNYKGIDEAKNWVNTSDATEFNAPTTLIKIVDNPAAGLASLKLTTAYWKNGTTYGLDTLIGSLLQQTKNSKRPKSFEFTYKCSPVLGDEVLVGVQLTKLIGNSIIVIGEGFFTSNKIEENWVKEIIDIEYFSNETPEKISFIALSSANAVINNGEKGYAKIGSTLFLDEFKLNASAKKETVSSKYYIHVYPNPAKSFINLTTNSPEEQQIEIYNLSSKLLLSTSFTKNSKIDISALSSGTYIYKVYSLLSGEITTSNKFNVIR